MATRKNQSKKFELTARPPKKEKLRRKLSSLLKAMRIIISMTRKTSLEMFFIKIIREKTVGGLVIQSQRPVIDPKIVFWMRI